MARSRTTKPIHEFVPAPPSPGDDSCNEWCAGMHLIETECSDHPAFRWYDVGDLMVMGAERRPGHPLLYLYKHRETRRYMNIDADGVPWRYVAPADDDWGSEGSYVRLPSLDAALDGLALWELPIMRNAPIEEVRQAYAAVPKSRYRSFTDEFPEDVLLDDESDDDENDPFDDNIEIWEDGDQ